MLLVIAAVIDLGRFHLLEAVDLANFVVVWVLAATVGLVVRDRAPGPAVPFLIVAGLAVAALASRLTNVAVIDTACGYQGYHTWKDLGVTVDGHGIGHTHPDDPKRNQSAVPIRRFYAERIADQQWKKLKEISQLP